MPHADFLVCEPTGLWATEFRRHLSPSQRPVHELRSLDEARDGLDVAPASLLAIAVDCRTLIKTWEFVAKLSTSWPHARTILLAEPQMREWQWDLRTAGAVQVLFSWRQIPPILPLIGRHFATYPSRDRSFRQQIVDRLPWRDETIPPN